MKKIFIFVIIFITFSRYAYCDEKYHLVTSDFPPFTFAKDLKVTGFITEIIREALIREKIIHDFEVLPWPRALDYALKNKNYAVFATYKRPEREKLFKWVGPIVDSNWTIFSLKNSTIKATKLEDLKNYAIGGLIGEAFPVYLSENGLKVEFSSVPLTNLQKLKHKRIDLWATTDLVGLELSNREKTPLKIVLNVKKESFYLAFNLQTSDIIIDKLNKTLIMMSSDGSIKKILKKYKIY